MSFQAMTVLDYWNASTNTPKLASGQGTNGRGYLVSVGGTTSLDGNNTWVVGDIAIFLLDRWVRFTSVGFTPSALPTTLPGTAGVLWLNNGVVSVS